MTIGKEKVDLIIFDLAPADPNTCDPYTGLSALTGQGAVYLRQRDGGIQRVRYDLKYSDTQHGGHRDMPLLVEIDLKDWNSDALPPITEPVSPSGRATPTATPAAGSGATYSAITFSSEFDQEKLSPINPAKTFPYGVKIIYAYWTYSNVVPETEFAYDWYRDSTRVDGAAEYFTNSSGKTFQWLLIGPTPKTPLDPGNYRFVVRVGDQEILSDTFVIQR